MSALHYQCAYPEKFRQTEQFSSHMRLEKQLIPTSGLYLLMRSQIEDLSILPDFLANRFPNQEFLLKVYQRKVNFEAFPNYLLNL